MPDYLCGKRNKYKYLHYNIKLYLPDDCEENKKNGREHYINDIIIFWINISR